MELRDMITLLLWPIKTVSYFCPNCMNSLYNFYLPYVRMFLCKSSIIYQSIALWSALSVELKKLSSFKSFKHQYFHILLLRYSN